ncbi:hypothetical protein J2X36_000810 [Methylobacterium sp. BE186]|uniref:hypothetical protein n=1 Tax=Methylobacterium sp. BE186 TaxID=2817715 RepID=UPI00285CD433|nr:hypothetical protein [Methylobacterium sp. BE186]MDR7036074.1 hypothetical protein [Methylobacterium sp. BE186]
MSRFWLHRGWREPNGLVTDHVTAVHPIEAATASAAVSAALADDDFLISDGANLAWLTDERGALGLGLDQHQKAMTAARATAEA